MGSGEWQVGREEGLFPQKARKGAAVLTSRTAFGMTMPRGTQDPTFADSEWDTQEKKTQELA